MGEIQEIAKEVVNNEKIFNRLIYLYCRWQDEKQYEDFKDYEENLRALIKETFPDLKVYQVTKQPFGFKVAFEDVKLHFRLKQNNTTTSFVVQRVAR